MSRSAGRLLSILAAGLLAASALLAGPPAHRIADINQDPDGASIEALSDSQYGVLVGAQHLPDPRRLWWTDGTARGTRLLGDMSVGAAVALDGVTVFSATPTRIPPDSGPDDWELWRTDGTSEGTTRVADIWPGPGESSYPEELVRIGERVFFTADDPDHGRELWVTDGTPQGTRMVLDVRPGRSSSQPSGLVPCGATLYFTADDEIHGRELWLSDGTAAGTRLVRDIFPGPDGSSPWLGAAFDGVLVFAADDGVHGSELWTTDGTAAGTTMAADLTPGPESSYPSFFLRSTDAVVFVAFDVAHGAELWRTDLTLDGTRLLFDVVPGPESSYARPFAVLGDVLVFHAYDAATGWERLWRLDAALAAPEPFTIQPDVFSAVTHIGHEIVYVADDGVHGTEPWRSDGTREGTRLLADVRPGPLGSAVDCEPPYGRRARLGNELLLAADDGAHGCELVGVDLATGAVRIVHEFAPGTAGSDGRGFEPFRDRLVFSAWDHEERRRLWSTDGTAERTQIVPLPLASTPSEFVSYLDQLLVTIVGSASDDGLWSWDGTSEDANRLGDFGDQLTPWGGEIWYRGYDPTFGSQIFRTNGTPEGTGMAFVVNRGSGGFDQYLGSLHPAAGVLAFTATGSRGVEPHVSTGYDVRDFDLWPGGSSFPGGYRSAPGSSVVWFSARTPGEGDELWRIDGLGSSWPSFVKDIWPGPGSSQALVRHVWPDDRALLRARDLDHGDELWVSDGTDQGTMLLRDIKPGRPSGFTGMDVAAGPDGVVYFAGDDGLHGPELWRTDGRTEGTFLVADLNPGTEGSSPVALGFVDGMLLFGARDAEHGRELWVSDGTAPGTRLFQDVRPGPDSSFPYSISLIGDRIVLYAYDDEAGYEPWSFKRCRLPGADTLAPEGSITAPSAGTCFGPKAVPVVVEDTFADRCDDEIVRTYVPEGGPSYAAHGDVALTLEAADSAGNTARDARSFTIDLVPPAVTLAPPPPLPKSLPASVPFSLIWTAGDDDGASGGVLRENVFVDDCLLWDGLTYGDEDGLLSDETMVLGRDELCTLARACGVVELRNPVVRVEASDCGGNAGSVSTTVSGAFRIPTGMCGL